MKLVIVQTPSQAKMLTDVLGEGWRVEPCYGAVRDLPSDALGIDVENDFRPTFAVVSGKGNIVRRQMKAIRESEAVYAATAPNREGEALAWHLLALSPDVKDKSIYRVILTALTPDTIRTAFAAPRPLDMKQVEAHVARRIVERLIGWSVSASARKVLDGKPSLTWGGMVALRLLSERESQIATFVPQTAWHASVVFARDGERFTAQVLNAKGVPLTMRNEEQASQLHMLLQHGAFWVDKTGQTMKTLPALGTLTLRHLVETVEREFGLPPERTLALVATLFEAGWINQPDGVLLPEASEAAKTYICREYGTDYVALGAVVTEGIAPTDVNRVPETLPGDGATLYGRIWRSFIAAHMTPAQERITAARILVGASQGKPYPLELRAMAVLPYFDGWRRVLPTAANDETIPSLTEGETLAIQQIVTDTVTSEAPSRYTLAVLVGALVESGLDVPSAVQAVESLHAVQHITDEGRALALTERGNTLAAYLADTFGELTSPAYAAELAADLGGVASSKRERLDVLRAFWSRFGSSLRPTPAPRTIGEHKPIVLRPAEEV